MAKKIYTVIWALYFALAALFFVTGNLTMMTGIVFGFFAFGIIYFGMMSVLPSTVGHNAPREEPKPAPAPAVAAKPAKESYVPAGSAVVH